MTLQNSSTEDIKDSGKGKNETPDIKGDWLNAILLMILYLLQNLVNGILQALPLVMQNRKVSYVDQAEFSFVGYPGCMKLLWAPIVDCMYSKRFGRRKSWIIPMQYMMSSILLFASLNLEDWLGSEDGTRKPKIRLLTVVFFTCSLFTNIQDVALDAWAITMLQRKNIGYAVTSQNVGTSVGQFISFVLFIVLDSKDFCNMFRSVPKNYGFFSLADSLFVSSIVMMIATTILIFKRDTSFDSISDDSECRLSLKKSYAHLWRVLQVRPIQITCIILLTYKMGFGPLNGVAALKLIDAGITRDKFVLLTILALPFQMILSLVLHRYVAGPRSMRAFIMLYILKLIAGAALPFVLFFSPLVKESDNTLPVWYYCLLVSIYNARNVIKYLMGIAGGTFFLALVDPKFGGIYITLLNTISNIGHNWPATLCLWIVSQLSIQSCTKDEIEMTDNCYTIFDGFLTETIIFTVLGFLWLCWGKKQIHWLEKTDPSAWIPERKSPVTGKDEPLLQQ